MINWLRKKKEESRLRNWLGIALAHPEIKEILRVENATFTLRNGKDVIEDLEPSERYLGGTYNGPWPAIKGARSDCRLPLGEFVSENSDVVVSLAAYIVSRRVVGFIFSPKWSEFAVLAVKSISFKPSKSGVELSKSPAIRPSNFPAWLPDILLVSEEINEDYRLPSGYDDKDSEDFFKWFKSLQCGEFLLTRPDTEEEIEVSNQTFLTVGIDDCGNYLALSKSPGSKLLFLEHSTPEPVPLEAGIRGLVQGLEEK